MHQTVIVLILLCARASLASSVEPVRPVDRAYQEVQQTGESQQQTTVALNMEYFIGYWSDAKNVLTSPGRWESSDWIAASLVTGVAAGFFTQDDKIKIWVQQNKTDSTSHLADDISKLYTYSFPAIAGLGLYGYLAADQKATTSFLLGTESAIITAAFVQTLKRSTGRHRPYTGDSHDTWSGPTLSGHNDHLSFPSGDASTAFAMASVVASEYDNMIVPPLVYTASLLVALERVYNNAHWSSDVFLGSAIGYFTGKSLVRYHTGIREAHLSIVPLANGKELGCLVSYQY
jgi:membrane-associated phospholipid phosphatase